MKPIRIAVVGCGHISTQYGVHTKRYPELEFAGATDLELSRAETFCKEYGGKVYPDFDAILQDDSVDVVLNLTVHRAHFDLNSRAMKAGKHVFTEKPMALNYKDAAELIRISEETGRLIGAAPITYMGEGVQTANRFLEADRLGKLRVVYAEANWGQIERWISAPAPYFTVGPLLDIGVYAITAMTFLLGPVQRVWGYSSILKNPRHDKHGNEFPVTAPDFSVGIMEFASGVKARLTSNYYVLPKGQSHLKGLEFHGDEGSFCLGDYHGFGPKCRYIPYGGPALEVPLLRQPEQGMDRALGLIELAKGIRGGGRHRGAPDHAAHVIEIMENMQISADQGRQVELTSTFERPAPMEWTEGLEIQIPEIPEKA